MYKLWTNMLYMIAQLLARLPCTYCNIIHITKKCDVIQCWSKMVAMMAKKKKIVNDFNQQNFYLNGRK